jgi:hypothetical protein
MHEPGDNFLQPKSADMYCSLHSGFEGHRITAWDIVQHAGQVMDRASSFRVEQKVRQHGKHIHAWNYLLQPLQHVKATLDFVRLFFHLDRHYENGVGRLIWR